MGVQALLFALVFPVIFPLPPHFGKVSDAVEPCATKFVRGYVEASIGLEFTPSRHLYPWQQGRSMGFQALLCARVFPVVFPAYFRIVSVAV